MSDAISLAPLAQLATPFVLAVAGVIVKFASDAIVAEVKKYTGYVFQQGAVDKVDAAIEDKIGAAVAAADGNLATVSIPAGSKIVVDIANEIIDEIPDLLKQAGITPASVAGMVHGEIGKWQKEMTRVSPPIQPAKV